MSWEAPIERELKQVEQGIRRSVASDEKELTRICMHVIGAGGKRLRPGIAILSYEAAGGGDLPKFIGIAASFELIHSATLIHDDINDQGEVRRGRIAAHKKFGVQKALVAGDFMFVRSFKLGGNWDKKVVQIISDACTETAESEILQSAHEFDPKTDVKTYFKIITGKTAKLIEAAALVGAHMADADDKKSKALGGYALNLGLAFQIIDDVLDLNGTEKELGKPLGIDLVDGKLTLPLLFAVEDEAYGDRISRLFVKRKKTRAEVKRILELVAKTSALDRARLEAAKYSNKAKRMLSALEPSPYKDALLELAQAVVDRRS
ncbi:MAG: polyprenyl synthetase family protein [Methanomassiliicoccales archaeon]|nr:polyprenyl synthetase family protein [Methanomassiliicoccales archaeon]